MIATLAAEDSLLLKHKFIKWQGSERGSLKAHQGGVSLLSLGQRDGQSRHMPEWSKPHTGLIYIHVQEYDSI